MSKVHLCAPKRPKCTSASKMHEMHLYTPKCTNSHLHPKMSETHLCAPKYQEYTCVLHDVQNAPLHSENTWHKPLRSRCPKYTSALQNIRNTHLHSKMSEINIRIPKCPNYTLAFQDVRNTLWRAILFICICPSGHISAARKALELMFGQIKIPAMCTILGGFRRIWKNHWFVQPKSSR